MSIKKRLSTVLGVGAIGVMALVATAGIATAAGASSVPATPSTTSPTQQFVHLTQADNGKTFYLQSGVTVAVTLDGQLNWNVRSTNPKVIHRVPVITGPANETVFRTDASGRAELVGYGRPVCQPDQACPTFVVYWHVNIVVVPAIVK